MNRKYFGVVIGICIAFGILAAAFIFILPKNTSKIPQVVTPTPAPTAKKVPPISIEEVVVKVTQAGFYPNSITVKPSTRIVWINETDKKVTINSDDHPVHKKYPLLNLGEFAPKQAVQTVLRGPGTYTYHNHHEPSMRGTIIVK